MGYKVNTFVAQPFENEFGQTINPGDDVLYMGTAWKQTKARRAVFEGVYVSPKGKVEAVRVGGIPDRRYKYDYAVMKGEWETVIRKAVLPMKRVYKLDTPMESMVGKTF